MKVSLNWVKQYVGFDLPPVKELVEKIGAQLGAVEEVIDLAQKYRGIVVAKVVECQKLDGSDHLNVCKIDDGNATQGVERDNSGRVQVVCGAPNVAEGLLVAWLPPGSTVPESYGREPFVLEAREIRGQKSNGMLASPKELALGDSHEGLLVIERDAKPGDDFAKVYELDDHIIDIENKMFTHRPDCFGQLGVAREIAGILGKPFHSPQWYTDQPGTASSPASSDNFKLEVDNQLPKLVPRFTAQVVSGITITPSDVETQSFLSKFGIRPINNVVDVTNAVMLITGQPLHAYDYDKVKALSGPDGAKLVVRNPKPGEKITLLNGKEIEPRNEAIMIATDQKLIGIGGVMGGSETEVDASTKNIILECATFDMYSIRRTSMDSGLFTDAVTRFTKGQSCLQNERVMHFAVNSLVGSEPSGGVAGELIDNKHLENQEWIHPPVSVDAAFINARLGVSLAAEEMKRLLENIEFKVEANDQKLTVTAPFWRTDIEIPEDVVEEVGRLHGYDTLPLELPKRTITPAKKDQLFELKNKIRNVLRKAGANEVLTYSFVHGNLLDKVGQDSSKAFQLANALSPELQYYRLSLTPSLLDNIHPNNKAGYGEFALFEIGKAHIASEVNPNEPDVPKEVNTLSLVFAADKKVAAQKYGGAAFYEARKYLANVLNTFRVLRDQIEFQPLAGADLYHNPWVEQLVAPFEPSRSAVLRGGDGLIWGVVGEFKASVRRNLKLPDFTAGFELDPLFLVKGSDSSSYVPLPRFPKVEQDMTLKVPADTSYQALFDFIWQKLTEVKPDQSLASLSPLDIYQREDDLAHKQVTLRLSLASFERTMTDNEVAQLLDEIAAAAKDGLHAERV